MAASRMTTAIAGVFGGIGVLLAAVMVVQPVAADTLPPSTCVTECTATFDTAGSGQSFTIPTGVTRLTATIAGSAGAPPSFAITNDPTGVGGTGGVSTLALGAGFAGTTVFFGVGGVGEGSWLRDQSALLAVAGGGGGGGYAAYLDIPGQILAVYPGGAGGSPVAAGVAAGQSATAFGSLPANGGGGTAVGGVAGVGQAPGTAGAGATLLAGNAVTLAAGGTGGSLLVGSTSHVGGRGGSGYTGGGGGAVQRNVDNGDVPADVVAPGGGGSGYLDASLTATAGAPNTKGGYLSFSWSYSPAIATSATSVHPGDSVPVSITGLPASVPFSVTLDGVSILSGQADAAGTASTSFVVPAAQGAGSFPLRLVVGADVVASSSPLSVVLPDAVAALAVTGADGSVWPASLGALLIMVGATIVVVRRRGALTR
jgi:hypothetical protein